MPCSDEKHLFFPPALRIVFLCEFEVFFFLICLKNSTSTKLQCSFPSSLMERHPSEWFMRWQRNRKMRKSFQNPKVLFLFLSLQEQFVNALFSVSVSFCPRVRVELLSYVRGAWTAAKPVCWSSYFDTPKHLPSLKHDREHRENNRERAALQPLLSGWSCTDGLSLRPIKGQCSFTTLQAPGGHILMDLTSSTHTFFPLRRFPFYYQRS